MDIAIPEEYRRKGYGYEAAKALNKYIFDTKNVLAVTRLAYLANVASCRIAEKLGGIQISEYNRRSYGESRYFFNFMNDRIPLAINYEIRKENWTPL